MPNAEPLDHPELADVGRLARRLVDRAVQTARTEDQPLRRLLLDHLGPDAAALPTVSATWPSYDHVNVQVGLEAWLEADGERQHEVFGITGIGMMRHMEIVGIGDLLQPPNHGPFGSASFGGVMTVAVPSGPDGQTHPCVNHGIYLVDDGQTRLAIVLQPVDRGPFPQVVLQITGQDQDQIQAILGEIRTLASDRSVFRGQVISFGPEVFGPGRQVPMNFLERPSVARHQIVLPDADARRQLLRLYQGHLVLELTHPDTVIERTDGVTAAFLKELLRKAALLACEADPSDGPIRVTDVHLNAALDQLLDTRNQLTRVLLGGEHPHPHPQPPPAELAGRRPGARPGHPETHADPV
jgi:hypothetical protein